jgi:hypothetical protein
VKSLQVKKKCYTADFSGQWKAFSTHMKWHLINVRPSADIDLSCLHGRECKGTATTKIGANPTDFLRPDGFLTTICYASKPLKSIFSIRYFRIQYCPKSSSVFI